MAYSAVTQPSPLPRRKGGTLSSTEAVQMTRVFPVRMRQLPSAVGTKFGMISCSLSCSGLRPSFLSMRFMLLIY